MKHVVDVKDVEEVYVKDVVDLTDVKELQIGKDAPKVGGGEEDAELREDVGAGAGCEVP